MSLSYPKRTLQRIEEKETSYYKDDSLAFAKGIRNGFLIVIPFWLVVLYLT
ncbi:hypothetical protein [Bacillus cereus]|jgi:hypothetical protein|uniref:hypothetical protein n=1 Tax=Bacillus cereus TaxID=1396 RepID=UPI00030AAA3D